MIICLDGLKLDLCTLCGKIAIIVAWFLHGSFLFVHFQSISICFDHSKKQSRQNIQKQAYAEVPFSTD